MSFAVVDSGASKAHWRWVAGDGNVQAFETEGIHPHHITSAQMSGRIPAALQNHDIEHLFFYGAGCSNPQLSNTLRAALQSKFKGANIHIYPDYWGAARALFAHRQGVVGILGTGSSCCLYDGREVVANSCSLGYLLGDEGSATDLGKRLLRAYYYRQLPAHLAADLPLNLPDTLHSLYHSNSSVTYLANFVPFLLAHKTDIFVEQLIGEAFSDFITYHIKPLWKPNLPLGIVGSVGCLLADIFTQVAAIQGITEIQFLQYPINNLVKYHQILT
ncbi:ATPase [Bacteroidia bacterium]|nr:ATPase [Bacteroidia bacterium]